MAIVAYTGHVKRTVTKTRCVHTSRKHTAAQHARFLADINPLQVHTVCRCGDPQEEFDKFYAVLLSLLDRADCHRYILRPTIRHACSQTHAAAEEQVNALRTC